MTTSFRDFSKGQPLYADDLDAFSRAINAVEVSSSRTERKLEQIIYATDFGVRGDDEDTDYTAAMQAFLDAMAAATSQFGLGVHGILPPGRIKATNLYVTRPGRISGQGESVTSVYQPSSATGPLWTVRLAHSNYNYPTDGYPVATLNIENMRCYGGNRANGGTSRHAFDVRPASVNPVQGFVYFDRVLVDEFSGDGYYINGVGVGGFRMRATDCGRDCFSMTGTNDCHFMAVGFGSAGRYSININNCSQYSFGPGSNAWSGGVYCLNIYAENARANGTFWGMMFDRSQTDGVFINAKDGEAVLFCGCTFIENGQSSPNTYADIRQEYANPAGAVRVASCQFRRAYQDDNTKDIKYHFAFDGPNATIVLDGLNYVAGGLFRSNSLTRVIRSLGSVTARLSGAVEIDGALSARSASFQAPTQYTGLGLGNDAGKSIWTVKGWNSDNGAGVLDLYESDGTTVGVRLAVPTSGETSEIGGTLKVAGLVAEKNAQFAAIDLKNTTHAVARLIAQGAGGTEGMIELRGTSSSDVTLRLGAKATGAVQVLMLNGPYADDAAAASAGIPVQGAYRKTGGTVAWRVS